MTEACKIFGVDKATILDVVWNSIPLSHLINTDCASSEAQTCERDFLQWKLDFDGSSSVEETGSRY